MLRSQHPFDHASTGLSTWWHIRRLSSCNCSMQFRRLKSVPARFPERRRQCSCDSLSAETFSMPGMAYLSQPGFPHTEERSTGRTACHQHRKEIEEIRSGCRRLGNSCRTPPENERRNPFPRASEVRRQPSTGSTAVASLRQAEASMPGSQTRTSMMIRCFQRKTRIAPAESLVYFCKSRCVLSRPNGRRDTIASPRGFPGEVARVSQHYSDASLDVRSFGLACLCRCTIAENDRSSKKFVSTVYKP